MWEDLKSMGNAGFFEVLEHIRDIKKQELTLPIARKACTITTLLVGDDLSLKSSIGSPATYDRDIVKMLQKKIKFIDQEESKEYVLKYDEFIRTISNIDKIVMLWGLFKCTYETIGTRKITCPNDCDKPKSSYVFEDKIFLSDLLNEDSLTLWDKDKPFYDYLFEIEVDYSGFKYVFQTRLPSMKDHGRILNLLSTSEVQSNLEKTGSIFTKPMEMALLITKMEVFNITKNEHGKNVRGEKVAESSNSQEILMAFRSRIPEIISEDIYKKYNDHFEKYSPKFYKNMVCPNCGHNFKYDVDIETDFFRRSILAT